ncbi:MAG: hypothetical protein US51_C0042G0013 [Microgenomates group bacterium GW2011_GWA2_37_6]|nr:MAG: hypothetical protein US51_C0042G0013 [Microgenomates group bacterium GW2011_GWA2_37_6]
MLEQEHQLSAKLRRTGRGPDGEGWELTLSALDTDGVGVLDELTDLQMGDDHSKTLFLVLTTQRSTESTFDVFTGPDITPSEEHLKELYFHRASDDQIPVQVPVQDQTH